ncbi:MAG TPA: hypothetical protein VMN76_07615 [Acidobacteriota bacterium]|nr:hypothetical protein [Acidobacteriota bacterium]
MLNKVFFSVYVLFCFEIGIFLVIFPWMEVWRHNSLLQLYPGLQSIFLNNFFRGAVTGLGLANIIIGTWEVANFRYYFRKA